MDSEEDGQQRQDEHGLMLNGRDLPGHLGHWGFDKRGEHQREASPSDRSRYWLGAAGSLQCGHSTDRGLEPQHLRRIQRSRLGTAEFRRDG